MLEAVGVGALIALAVLTGGPAAHAGAAVGATVADSVAAALGSGAGRLDPI